MSKVLKQKNVMIEELTQFAYDLPEPITSEFLVLINGFHQGILSFESFDAAVSEMSLKHFTGEGHMLFMSEVERIKPRRATGLMFTQWKI